MQKFDGVALLNQDYTEILMVWIQDSAQSFWRKISVPLTGQELDSFEELHDVLERLERGHLVKVPIKSFVNYLQV